MILAANIFGRGGLGYYARALAAAISIRHQLQVYPGEWEATGLSYQSDVWIQHGWSHKGQNSFRDCRITDAPEGFVGSKIFCAGFDFRFLGPDRVVELNRWFTCIWADSEWSKGTAQAAGVVIPIHVLPPPVPSWPAESRVVRDDDVSHKFVFLHVANGSPWVKGTDNVIDAFIDAFAGDYTTQLVLKLSGSAVDHREERTRLLARLTEQTNVKIDLQSVNHDEMAYVYAAADCYVHASRSDSLGLPALEAAAVGLPLITHVGGAHTGALFDGSVLLVPYQLRLFPANQYRDNQETVAVEVSVKALSEAMRQARSHFVRPCAASRLLIHPSHFVSSVSSLLAG